MNRPPYPWRDRGRGHGYPLNGRSRPQDLRLAVQHMGHTERYGSTGTLVDVGHIIADSLYKVCGTTILIIDDI